MKLRPKWSKIDGGTAAWCGWAYVFVASAMLCACSSLDPNIGPRRLETDEDVGDAGESDGGESEDATVGPGEVSFKLDIRPLMDRPSKGDPSGRGCKSCHYRTEASHLGTDLSALDLSTLGSLRQGGGSSGRRIVVAGKPRESVLYQVLLGQYPYANRMPKNGNPYWSDAEIDLVETWIAQGAKGADDE